MVARSIGRAKRSAARAPSDFRFRVGVSVVRGTLAPRGAFENTAPPKFGSKAAGVGTEELTLHIRWSSLLVRYEV